MTGRGGERRLYGGGMTLRGVALVGLLVAASCGDADEPDVAEPDPAPTVTSSAPQLSVDSTWQWQLQGDIDTAYDVDVYDIDLFDAPDQILGELHDTGRVVICYFSAGSYEEWRDDAGDFSEDVLGESLDGWEGERWVDIRSDSVRAIMTTRLDLAVDRGCDGVEPDNVTGFDNDTGFDLSARDQLDYNRFLAAEAHARDLLIGLKNDLDQIPDLVGDFDFAVNEECFEFDECDANQPFIDAGKPVFSAEYADRFVDEFEAVCDVARAADHRTLILPLDLDGSFRISCDE